MSTQGFYESGKALSEYLLFHYGREEETLPWPAGPREALFFPARVVSECLQPALLPAEARALDLGCAVGRSSFELARHCRSVIGIDYSHAFIEAARRLQQGEALPFRYVIEGDRWAEGTATAPGGIELPRVEFQQGDALALPEELGDFDVVLMANLIDRLPDPRRLLENLPRLVRPGGQLIFVSPYTWTEEYTPRSAWLSGSGGESESSFEAIRQSLAPHFRLLNRKDLPFLIREHARKFQWSVAEAAVWQRLS